MVYDIIIAVLILLAFWRGWKKGAIKQIISLAVILAAALLGTVLGTSVGKALDIGQKYLQPIVGFFVVFLLLIVAGGFLSRLLNPKSGVAAGANNFFGALFSTLKTVFIIGLIAAFLRMFAFPPDDSVKETTLYPLTMKTSSLIVSQIRPLVSQLESSDIYEEIMPEDSTSTAP